MQGSRLQGGWELGPQPAEPASGLGLRWLSLTKAFQRNVSLWTRFTVHLKGRTLTHPAKAQNAKQARARIYDTLVLYFKTSIKQDG